MRRAVGGSVNLPVLYPRFPRPHLKLIDYLPAACPILFGLISFGHLPPDPLTKLPMASLLPLSLRSRRDRR